MNIKWLPWGLAEYAGPMECHVNSMQAQAIAASGCCQLLLALLLNSQLLPHIARKCGTSCGKSVGKQNEKLFNAAAVLEYKYQQPFFFSVFQTRSGIKITTRTCNDARQMADTYSAAVPVK